MGSPVTPQASDPWEDAYVAARQKGLSQSAAKAEADRMGSTAGPVATPPSTPPGTPQGPASYGGIEALLNGMSMGAMPSVMAANRTNQQFGTDPRGMLDESLAAQSAAMPAQMPTPGQVGAAYQDQRGQVGQAQQQFQTDHPVANMGAELAGALAMGKIPVAMINHTANSLTRLTGLAPKWARAAAPVLIGTGLGAAEGGIRAEPGQTGEGAMQGAKWGFGLALGLEVATKVKPFLKYLTGTTTAAERAEINNLMIIDKLARTNQSVQEVMDRADMLLTLTGQNPSVLEAMGSQAGTTAVRSGVPVLGQEAAGQAFGAAKALEQPVSVLGGKAGASRVTKGQLAWRASRFDLNEAKRIAMTDMALDPASAKQTVELADQINKSRRVLAKALVAASKRSPTGIEDAMRMMAAGELSTQHTAKVAAFLQGPFARQSAVKSSEEMLSTLLQTNPGEFFKNLGTFQSTHAGKQAVKGVFRGMAAGHVGGQRGAVGTTYED